MSIKLSSKFLAIAIGALVFLGTSVVSYQFWLIIRDPVHVVHSVYVRSPVEQGSPIIVETVVTRTQMCRSSVHRFIAYKGTNEVLWSGIFPGGAAGRGIKIPLTLSIEIPFVLPVGEYLYRSYVFNDCGFRSFTTISPDGQFEVVARR